MKDYRKHQIGAIQAKCRHAKFTVIFFCIAVAVVSRAEARTYSTRFALAENPISEGGGWINGRAVGLDWANVSTRSGLCIGLQSGKSGYDDATALLNGPWGPNQSATATVYTKNQRLSVAAFKEVEIRLRSSLTPHNCTGYEVVFSLKSDSSCYVQIVRWNGPLGSFNYVATTSGSQYVLHTGDKVTAEVFGNTITAYINGKQVLQGIDSTYSTGSVGLGFYLQGITRINNDYGFTSFAASDEARP